MCLLLQKVNMRYFNPSGTNRMERVKNYPGKEAKEKQWISEEESKSHNTGTGKGILRKQLAYSFLFTQLTDDLAGPS